MIEAAFWGLVAASSLLIGALAALTFRLTHPFVGLAMAFGAGALISAVSYELIGASILEGDTAFIAASMLLGAFTFVGGDALISRMQAPAQAATASDGGQGEEGASAALVGLALVLGAILDGIPESFVLGFSVADEGGVSLALLVAVFLSNLPEALAASSELAESGWPRARILGMWGLIVAVSALAAALGQLFISHQSGKTGARVEAFAGGAILAMLTDTMVPEAFREGGRYAGIVTTLGFILGVALSAAEQ